MLADITGRKIETVANTQETGAVGAALTVAAGIQGVDVMEMARMLIKPVQSYLPDGNHHTIYERNYQVFKKLYRANAEGFHTLNGKKEL